VIPYYVLQELDKIKMEKSERGYNARVAVRTLKSLGSKVYYDLFEDNEDWILNNDDQIVNAAKRNNCTVVTGDYLVQLKALSLGLDYIDLELNESNQFVNTAAYTGVRDIYLNPSDAKSMEDVALIYQMSENVVEENILKLATNEYVIVWDTTKPTYDKEGKVKGYAAIEKFKFNGEKLVRIKHKNLENIFTGKIKPVNVKQELAFDMLQDKNTTVKFAQGGFGVGKDFLMISHAIDLLWNNKIEKIVWVRNNVGVKDVPEIGFLPGSKIEKLMDYAMILADHLGGLDALENFIDKGRIEVQHLGAIRGRDLKNSIIYVSECQNNTRQHIQLLLGRVAEGSQLWLNGDLKQVDNDKFISNNGVNALKQLRGQKLYGQITLDKVERSETAKLADLLD
jgi:predicted ribonuclease YlaK